MGKPLAVHLGPGQPGEQVVPRVGAAEEAWTGSMFYLLFPVVSLTVVFVAR